MSLTKKLLERKAKLEAAYEDCEYESLEYIIQYMSDVAEVDEDVVINFLIEKEILQKIKKNER